MSQPISEVLGRNLTQDGVLVLTMNRPDAYNSLSLDLIEALSCAIRDAQAAPEARVIVVRGAGRGFCAGHDLQEVLGFETDDGLRALLEACANMMALIKESPKPIITQVHGAASAAGCQMVASSDLAFASTEAIFSTPGVHIGLFCSTPMVALSRAVSRKHSLQMLLTGDPVDATFAEKIGLINEAIPPGQLSARVMEVAKKIASKSSFVVQLGKSAFVEQSAKSAEDAYTYCNEVVIRNLKAEDAQEGISAFLQKRTPRWTDQ